MTKQSIIIKGRTLSWDVPVKVIKNKKKCRKRKKEPNCFKTNFVQGCPTKDFTKFLEEHPYFSLDTPVIIDEPDKEWFKEQYEKDLRNMIKAVGYIEI